MLAPGPRAAAVGRVSTAPHEAVTTFARAGLALHPRLAEMLDEHPSHRTERRGCGYTQATRFLSTYINQPREPDATTDFGVLAAWPKPRIESLALRALAAGWPQGWRRLDLCDPAILATLTDDATTALLVALPRTLAQVQNAVQHEESRLLADLIRQILAPEPGVAPDMPEMREKPEIGSCSQAEEFFLEIAHGRVRRGGQVNLFVDDAGRPLLIEKMALGESHSAMAVAPVAVGGVLLPPGSLYALQYPDDARALRETNCGHVFHLSVVAQARFLRLTTLAVSPAVRARAFSSQFEAQLRNDLLSPASTTIEDLKSFAVARLGNA